MHQVLHIVLDEEVVAKFKLEEQEPISGLDVRGNILAVRDNNDYVQLYDIEY